MAYLNIPDSVARYGVVVESTAHAITRVDHVEQQLAAVYGVLPHAALHQVFA